MAEIRLAKPGDFAGKPVRMGTGSEPLVLAAGIANGCVQTVAWVDDGVVGQDQEFAGYAGDYLLEGFRAAGFTRSAGKQCVSGEQVLSHEKAYPSVGVARCS